MEASNETLPFHEQIFNAIKEHNALTLEELKDMFKEELAWILVALGNLHLYKRIGKKKGVFYLINKSNT